MARAAAASMPRCRRVCSGRRCHRAKLRADSRNESEETGLLALTFQNDTDYDRIREDDRVSLTGLSGLAAGKPVACDIVHADGTTESLSLNHGYSEPQLAWFRAGAA